MTGHSGAPPKIGVLGFVARATLLCGGLAAMGFGASNLLISWEALVSFGIWFLAGPAVHDLILVPVTILVSAALTRLLPLGWRNTVGLGAMISGVLILLSVPVLIASAHPHPNPTLVDRPYPLNLLAALGIVWSVVAIILAIRHSRKRFTRTPSAQGDSGPPG